MEKKDDTYKNVSFKNYTFVMNLTHVLPYNVSLRRDLSRWTTVNCMRPSQGRQTSDDRYDLLLEIFKKISIPSPPSLRISYDPPGDPREGWRASIGHLVQSPSLHLLLSAHGRVRERGEFGSHAVVSTTFFAKHYHRPHRALSYERYKS